MSFLDSPRDKLNPEIFDSKMSFRKDRFREIKNLLYTIVPADKVERLFLMGSSAGFQYNDSSDIDVLLVMKKGESRKDWHPVVKEHNGALLKGTKHPINFFVQEYLEKFNFEDASYPIYDLTNDKWEVYPKKVNYVPKEKFSREIWYANQYLKPILSIVKSMNRNKALLTKLVPGTKKYNVISNTIDKQTEALVYYYRKLDKDRKDAYYGGWGTPRDSQQNIIYKILEYHKVHELLEMLDKLYGDKNVNEP